VCWDGNIGVSCALTFVTRRNVDLRAELKLPTGVATLGDDNSIAAAYAFDRVLKAVAEVGSISVLVAVPDWLVVAGVVAGLV
jgi:hypothetical protein